MRENPAISAAPSLETPVAFSVYVKLVLVALFWGGTFISGRVIVEHLPPMTAATGRFAVSVILLLLMAWKLEGGLPRLTRQQLLGTFLLGLTGIFAYNICFFSALHYLPASRTALFVALNPIMTALLLAGLFGERLGRIKWLGIAIAFCGTAIVITHGELLNAVHDISQTIGKGELFIMGAVFCWATYTIIGRNVLKSLSPLAATTYASLWGLVMLGLGTLSEWENVDLSYVNFSVSAAILYHGILGTVVAFVWYYEGVKILGPSRTSVFTNLVPIFGVALAAIILAEPITLSMVLGGGLTLCGVMLTNGIGLRSRRTLIVE